MAPPSPGIAKCDFCASRPMQHLGTNPLVHQIIALSQRTKDKPSIYYVHNPYSQLTYPTHRDMSSRIQTSPAELNPSTIAQDIWNLHQNCFVMSHVTVAASGVATADNKSFTLTSFISPSLAGPPTSKQDPFSFTLHKACHTIACTKAQQFPTELTRFTGAV